MVSVVPPKPVIHGDFAQIINNILGLPTMSILSIWIAIALNLFVHCSLGELLRIPADSEGHLVLIEEENVGINMTLGKAVRGERKASVMVDDVGTEMEI